MRVGIIGFGLIGQRRAKGLMKLKRHKLVAVCDTNLENAKALQGTMRYEIEKNWQSLISRDDIDVVIVAVPHALSAQIVIAALHVGKHVFCEKPVGITVAQARNIQAAAARVGKLVVPGFNFRFYPGVQKMKALIESGAICKVTHARMVYGHGGRPGMEKEWKMKKKMAGGGALLDPGIHCIDLMRFFFGEFSEGELRREKAFWKADVEDNAFVFMKMKRGALVSAHFSTTEWKNLMRFEVFGEDGYIFLQGKSGSYGPQEVRMGERWFFESGKKEKRWHWGAEDNSFYEELKAFFGTLEGKPSPFASRSEDNIKALEVISALYKGGDLGISLS